MILVKDEIFRLNRLMTETFGDNCDEDLRLTYIQALSVLYELYDKGFKCIGEDSVYVSPPSPGGSQVANLERFIVVLENRVMSIEEVKRNEYLKPTMAYCQKMLLDLGSYCTDVLSLAKKGSVDYPSLALFNDTVNQQLDSIWNNV